MESTAPPVPTFSPTLDHLPGVPARFGLCEILPAAAIDSAQRCACAFKAPSVESEPRPFEERRPLMSLTNSPGEAADAGWAMRTGAMIARTVAITIRMRRNVNSDLLGIPTEA